MPYNGASNSTGYRYVMRTTRVPARKFTVTVCEEEGGGYSVRCMELPGAISQGDTRKGALRNVREAIQGYIEAFPEEEGRLKLKKEVVRITL